MITYLTQPELVYYIQENPMYQVYGSIPARVMPMEVTLITLFGVFSALVASWKASKNILSMTVSEVLHDE